MNLKYKLGLSLALAVLVSAISSTYAAAAESDNTVIIKDFDINFSADGEAKTYYSYRDKKLPDIFVKSEHHDEINLTHSDKMWDIEPQYSPDSKKIAYSSGKSMKHLDLWVMNADGSHKTKLHDDPNSAIAVAWSPDGSKIAFASIFGKKKTANIFVINADGTHLTNLTQDIPGTATSPSWSHDGARILYVHSETEKGQQDIYIMAADGSHKTRLTNTSIKEAGPVFTPDGSMIVYTGYDGEHSQLFAISAHGQQEGDVGLSLTQGLHEDAYFASFSPNGAHLIYSVGDWTNGFAMAHIPTPHAKTGIPHKDGHHQNGHHK